MTTALDDSNYFKAMYVAGTVLHGDLHMHVAFAHHLDCGYVILSVQPDYVLLCKRRQALDCDS